MVVVVVVVEVAAPRVPVDGQPVNDVQPQKARYMSSSAAIMSLPPSIKYLLPCGMYRVLPRPPSVNVNNGRYRRFVG